MPPMEGVQCTRCERPGQGRDREHADEDGAFYLAEFEGHHEKKAEERQIRRGIADVAHADQGVGIANDEAGMLKTDEGDEEADAAGDRRIKLVGNGAENHLADADRGDGQENDAGKKHRAEGRLPRHVHLDADGVSEIGVQAHAGGERDGVAGDDAHQYGAEGRGEAGGGGDGGQGNSGVGQDGRIDQHDVGHGQEGGDAGQNLGAPVGSEAGKFKVGFESLEHRRVLASKTQTRPDTK